GEGPLRRRTSRKCGRCARPGAAGERHVAQGRGADRVPTPAPSIPKQGRGARASCSRTTRVSPYWRTPPPPPAPNRPPAAPPRPAWGDRPGREGSRNWHLRENLGKEGFGVRAVEPGLLRQRDPVPQPGNRDCLHVVGEHVIPSGQQRPRAGEGDEV